VGHAMPGTNCEGREKQEGPLTEVERLQIELKTLEWVVDKARRKCGSGLFEWLLERDILMLRFTLKQLSRKANTKSAPVNANPCN